MRPTPGEAALGRGIGAAFLWGLFVGLVLSEMILGALLLALGTMLFVVRGYIETGEKVLTGALVFIALVPIGIEAVVYFLGP